jgi:DNA-binding transcriptional ArsR family regulator
MPRIHFTVKDLARTRLRMSLGPLAEAVFALGVLNRGGYPPYDRWRRDVTGRLHGLGGPIGQLTAPGAKVRAPDDLLSLVDDTKAEPDALRPLGLSRQEATVAALTLWRVAVAPYWNQIQGYLEADCDARGRIAMRRGVEGLLATLHPQVVWEPPVLHLPGAPGGDVHLGGTGLQLTPSIFLVDRPGVLLGSAGKEHHPVLLFASPPEPALAAALWEDPADPSVALGALIGQTRAAALRELTAIRTTRQLADRLGITPAGASQHTGVLRQAGLITTRRMRNTALHTVTALGMALLSGATPGPAGLTAPVRPRTPR